MKDCKKHWKAAKEYGIYPEKKESVKPYTSEDLMRLAAGEKIDPKRVIATYANPKNWGKMDDPSYGCRWYWKGPVICAFELASWVNPLTPPR